MIKIPLNHDMFAYVSSDAEELISSFKWYAHREGKSIYAIRGVKVNRKMKTIRMHRVLLEIYQDRPLLSIEYIDHIDGNGLNNCRDNLRIASNSQNQANRANCTHPTSSVYKGVAWNKRARRWMAQIKHNGKEIYLGLFIHEDDAARAYNKAAINCFGEYARINQIGVDEND